MIDEFRKSGRVWIKGALKESELVCLERNADQSGRLIADDALTKVIGRDGPVAHAIASILPNAFPTRLVSFNKSKAQNWGVPWHQDRIIAVSEKCDHPGFSNWSLKKGVWHCEPPLSILARMVFLRLHLDDEDDQSGSMEIALGSHDLGKVPQDRATEVARAHEPEARAAQRGDILALNMLMLHRSLPSQLDTPRRVLRVGYANFSLPAPLSWAPIG